MDPYLAQMNTNLGFAILFHLNIHEHELEQAFGKLTCGRNVYAPLRWVNSYILWSSVTYIWLRQIPIH